MAGPPSGAASLYYRLGGREPIAALVDVLSRRLAADSELGYHFAHLDIEELRRHQVAFLDAALGGPHAYHGPTLRQAHYGLEISERDFWLVVEHFGTALRICGVAEALSAEVLAKIAALRDEVVARA